MDKNVIKKVNVYPKRPIFFGKKEIRQKQLGIQMSVGDIFQCLLAMAKVEEVSGSGEAKELHLSDFYGQNWTKEEEDPEVIKISPANGNGKTVYTEQTNVNNTTKAETPNTNTTKTKTEATNTTKTETSNTTTTTTTKTETPNNTNSNKK